MIRLFVAQAFFRSGLVKAADWDTAVYLAANEYPVIWMEPVSAAGIGLTIELVGSVLLVLGLFSRPAALAMAVLTAIPQTMYVPITTNLMLIAILGWYAVSGPGAFSLDGIPASGFKQSALPLARPVIRAGEWSREHLGLVLMAAMRVWLGVSLLAYAHVFEPSIALATWLSLMIFVGIPDWLAITFAVLFFVGFASSVVSYVLVIVIGFTMVVGAHPDVTLYPVLLLAIYEARGTILNAFEKTGASNDPERIKRLLTFVIVGAGPTGVELAGAIAELAKSNVEREFRTVDLASARGAGPVSRTYPARISRRAVCPSACVSGRIGRGVSHRRTREEYR